MTTKGEKYYWSHKPWEKSLALKPWMPLKLKTFTLLILPCLKEIMFYSLNKKEKRKKRVFVSSFTTLLPHKSKPFLSGLTHTPKKQNSRAHFPSRPNYNPSPIWASYNPMVSPCKTLTRLICRLNAQQLKHEAPFSLAISHLTCKTTKKN